MNAAATVTVRPAKRMMMKVVLLLGPMSFGTLARVEMRSFTR